MRRGNGLFHDKGNLLINVSIVEGIVVKKPPLLFNILFWTITVLTKVHVFHRALLYAYGI